MNHPTIYPYMIINYKLIPVEFHLIQNNAFSF